MIKLVVAVAQNGIIGCNNQLLWRLSADLKHFKALTTGHVVVMGRKTFESIGKPLPNRVNLVISRSTSLSLPPEIQVVSSWEEAKSWCQAHHPDQIHFVIGGGEIYRLAMPDVDEIQYTRVFTEAVGDTTFPDIPLEEFSCVSLESYTQDEKNEFDYQFERWVRIKSA